MPPLFRRSLIWPVVASACLTATAGYAETGYLWELKKEMVMTGDFDGMAPSDTQKVCLPGKQPTTPGMDEHACDMLESSRSGNRGHWKAQCKDGVMVSSEFTYESDTTYRGMLTSSTRGGSSKMKIAGRRLGTCTLAGTQSAARAAESESSHEAEQRKSRDSGDERCQKQAWQPIRKDCEGRDSDAQSPSLEGGGSEALSLDGADEHDGSPQGSALTAVADELKAEVGDELIRKGVGRIKGLLDFR